jgi:hypothetical protein
VIACFSSSTANIKAKTYHGHPFLKKKDSFHSGKSLSEALIFVPTNPQYDNRLLIELQVQYMKIPSSEHEENMLCTQIVFLFLF